MEIVRKEIDHGQKDLQSYLLSRYPILYLHSLCVCIWFSLSAISPSMIFRPSVSYKDQHKSVSNLPFIIFHPSVSYKEILRAEVGPIVLGCQIFKLVFSCEVTLASCVTVVSMSYNKFQLSKFMR